MSGLKFSFEFEVHLMVRKLRVEGLHMICLLGFADQQSDNHGTASFGVIVVETIIQE